MRCTKFTFSALGILLLYCSFDVIECGKNDGVIMDNTESSNRKRQSDGNPIMTHTKKKKTKENPDDPECSTDDLNDFSIINTSTLDKWENWFKYDYQKSMQYNVGQHPLFNPGYKCDMQRISACLFQLTRMSGHKFLYNIPEPNVYKENIKNEKNFVQKNIQFSIQLDRITKEKPTIILVPAIPTFLNIKFKNKTENIWISTLPNQTLQSDIIFVLRCAEPNQQYISKIQCSYQGQTTINNLLGHFCENNP